MKLNNIPGLVVGKFVVVFVAVVGVGCGELHPPNPPVK